MVKIQYLSDSPEMATNLSTGAWANVTWRDDFTIPGRVNAEPVPGTSFAMVHDADSLYIAMKCGAYPGSSAEDIAHERIHIMLDCDREGRLCGKFIGNVDGSVSASTSFQNGSKDSWPGEVECEVHLRPEEWTAAVKIPLRQLPHQEGGLRRLRFNVARLNAVPEFWVCFPPIADKVFWEPDSEMGEAEFERPDLLMPFAWSVQREQRARFNESDGKATCRQKVRITNLSAEAREAHLRVEFVEPGESPSGQTQYHLRVGPGESHVETVELPIPEAFNFGFVRAALHDPDSGRCLCENQFLVEADLLSWKEHYIKRAEGKDGYTCHAAQMQIMPQYKGAKIAPYGLATMENDEVVCVAIAWPTGSNTQSQTLVTISEDGGATWGEYLALPGIYCRPVMLAYLGQGVVTFEAGDTTERFRMFSHDHGRTWDERVEVPPAPDGQPLGFEGNPLIERDSDGNAIRIAQIGQTLGGAAPHWKITEYLRWSEDGGRTWPHVVSPEVWKYTETYAGQTYEVGASEGSLVRAANGDLVAALRTFTPAWFGEHPHYEDSLEGTAISISKDNGEIWSPMQIVFETGRHHPDLIRMPNDDLVMTVIRRVDFHDQRLTSYRRGCDAVISRDNGVTWDVDHLYVLDDFPFCEGEHWISTVCGHLSSTVMPDGSILTGYGNYLAGGVLVRWRP